jgi:Mor family transcriptional regulator
MNIGEMINKFDLETDGTVKSFNEVFEMCPIKLDISPESIVEVGDIVSAGLENKRFLDVDGKLMEHLFERERYFVPEVRKPKKKVNPKHKTVKTFKAINVKTNEEFTGKTIAELARKMEVKLNSLRNFINKKGNTTLGREFIVKKMYNGKVEEIVKPIPKTFTYIASSSKETREYELIMDLVKDLKTSPKRVTRVMNTDEDIRGWFISKRRNK